jgi:hypothetical protein
LGPHQRSSTSIEKGKQQIWVLEKNTNVFNSVPTPQSENDRSQNKRNQLKVIQLCSKRKRHGP